MPTKQYVLLKTVYHGAENAIDKVFSAKRDGNLYWISGKDLNAFCGTPKPFTKGDFPFSGEEVRLVHPILIEADNSVLNAYTDGEKFYAHRVYQKDEVEIL